MLAQGKRLKKSYEYIKGLQGRRVLTEKYRELLDMVVKCGKHHYHPHFGAYSSRELPAEHEALNLPLSMNQKYRLDSLVSLVQK